VDQPLGMDPAEGLIGEPELAGAVGDHHGVALRRRAAKTAALAA